MATIDIGTNAVLLLVAERSASGEVRPVLERATITRLGEGVDRTGELSPAAIERTLSCLRGYADEARALGASATLAVGTSAMRDARGGEAFALRSEAVLGVRPRVVTGDEEARLTFVGALSGLSVEGPILLFDVGGGSTEIVVGQRGQAGVTITSAVSLNIGSVRLTERHVRSDPPAPAELDEVARAVDEQLARLGPPPVGARLLGVAGTVTTLAAVAEGISPYDGAKMHGASLTAEQVSDVQARLASLPVVERKKVSGLEPGRADVIVAGAILVSRLLKWAGAGEMLVSDRGVRWGVALEALDGRASKRPQ